ncbi:uncharacterized protein ASCRUDRAFT_8575 [Ascoidea rubescens DSM 1968]|uniref:Uncharacterized protein n=1 Tax=Ascoidea rubescens DSM 1968 TaxID=1344418 RepID=A0A1D2VF97_9ASCO|nr:hypothetical protein ASCRUDRAFT_8575 [Ascoidea rubescens DSM 1968]ODV60331.1 hypothetical protein ASCRUDRAFT_8575 [Ascoidea rubescens DSM 1968]
MSGIDYHPLLEQLALFYSSFNASIAALGSSLIGPRCFHRLFEQLDWESPESLVCINTVYVLFLNVLILFLLGVAKFPEIQNIIRHGRDSRNLKQFSFTSLFLEVVDLTIISSLNFRVGIDFNKFGEFIFIIIQDLILLIFKLGYEGYGRFINLILSLVGLFAYISFSDPTGNINNPFPIILSNNLVLLLNDKVVLPVLAVSKAFQIYKIYQVFTANKEKSIEDNIKDIKTGLSRTSVMLSLIGSILRYGMIKDNLQTVNFFSINIFLTFLLYIEIAYFQRSFVKTLPKDRAKKNN